MPESLTADEIENRLWADRATFMTLFDELSNRRAFEAQERLDEIMDPLSDAIAAEDLNTVAELLDSIVISASSDYLRDAATALFDTVFPQDGSDIGEILGRIIQGAEETG